MKKIIFWPAAFLILLSGCVTGPHPQAGLVYSGLKGPNHAVENSPAPTKFGESCAQSVLRLVAWGDASIDSARRQGEITKITAVDYEHFSVLENYGIYVKTCTRVSGI